jgi:hypothetical protein
MIKTFTGLTMAAAVAFTVGGALAQQAGGGPQPQLGTSAPNTQEGTTKPQTVPQPGSLAHRAGPCSSRLLEARGTMRRLMRRSSEVEDGAAASA